MCNMKKKKITHSVSEAHTVITVRHQVSLSEQYVSAEIEYEKQMWESKQLVHAQFFFWDGCIFHPANLSSSVKTGLFTGRPEHQKQLDGT